MRVYGRLDGVSDLTSKITELGAKLASRELKGVVKQAMQEPLHVARSNIPVGTQAHFTYRGRLVSPGYALSTLRVEVTIDKRQGAAVAFLGVGREAFYALQFVELGTSKMAARPWLVPAFVQSENQMLSGIRDELVKRVERIAKKRAAGKL